MDIIESVLYWIAVVGTVAPLIIGGIIIGAGLLAALVLLVIGLVGGGVNLIRTGEWQLYEAGWMKRLY